MIRAHTLRNGAPMSSKLVSSLALLAVGTSATVALGHPAKNAGAISGHVTFTGTPPKMKPIDMAKEPSCAKQHATPIMTESVVSGPNNALGNVVVYISAGDQAGRAGGGGGPVRSEGMRIHPARRRPAGGPAIGDLQRRSDLPQHPSAGQGELGVEQVPAAGLAADQGGLSRSPSSSRSSAMSIPGCTATSRCSRRPTTR